MSKIGRRYVAVLLLLLLIGGPLASARAASACGGGKRTEEELLQIATHDLVQELREAAAFIVAQRLQRSPLPPLAQLEELTRSPSEELRNEIAGVLQAAYAQALQSEQLTPEELAAEIVQGETFALRYARAAAVIGYLLSGGFPPELAHRFERLLGGGVVEYSGVNLDGELRAVRRAAYSRLWIYSYRNVWLALHPCAEWEGIAAGGATEELRSLAAAAYVNNFSCILPGPESRLKELALNGASHELRLTAARAYVDFHQFTGLEEMIALATSGENEELRTAVRWRLMRTLVSSGLSDGGIYEMAYAGTTPQLRQAAGWALGWRWADEALQGTLMISAIPRQSQAKAYSLEQALIIFAAENTVAHPELTQAAIGPLVVIWGG